jgi:uncharacterized membrane protein YagU involved in acid resistance
MIARLLTGTVAGTLATIPMTSYWEYMHNRLPGEPPRPLPPREIVEAIAVKAGVAREMSERDMQNAAILAHVGYGAAMGAIFGGLAPARPASAVGAGMLFGLAVWTGSYMGWLPATGVRHSPRYDQPARTGLMISSHLVWGAAMGAFAGLLLRK